MRIVGLHGRTINKANLSLVFVQLGHCNCIQVRAAVFVMMILVFVMMILVFIMVLLLFLMMSNFV